MIWTEEMLKNTFIPTLTISDDLLTDTDTQQIF